ncbi:hypothetical protein [Psychrobacter sp. I-STPA10]|uniref:hypothetical protein n=1 Tax=Psychrobacter sp. I-STPA10 TaxID=2585769 RepID=UPI001E53D430|nr:hypothetical protein [Psychrobacter sp. I-STPA10]
MTYLTKLAKTFASVALASTAMMGMGMMSAQAAQLHYTADCGVKELQMAKGKYDINRAGAIKGDKYCEYTFYAKKGQKISADIVGSRDLYPMLYSENSQDLSSETVTLDKTGEYSIRVLQPAAQARQGNTPKPFYLTVTIK